MFQDARTPVAFSLLAGPREPLAPELERSGAAVSLLLDDAGW